MKRIVLTAGLLFVMVLSGYSQKNFWSVDYKKVKATAAYSKLSTKTVTKNLLAANEDTSMHARGIIDNLFKVVSYGIDKGLDAYAQKFYISQPALNAIAIPKDTIEDFYLNPNKDFYLNFCTNFIKPKTAQEVNAGCYEFLLKPGETGGLSLTLKPENIKLNYLPVKISRRHNVLFTTFYITAYAITKDGKKEDFGTSSINVIMKLTQMPEYKIFGEINYPVSFSNLQYMVFSVKMEQKNPYKYQIEKTQKQLSSYNDAIKELIKLIED